MLLNVCSKHSMHTYDLYIKTRPPDKQQQIKVMSLSILRFLTIFCTQEITTINMIIHLPGLPQKPPSLTPSGSLMNTKGATSLHYINDTAIPLLTLPGKLKPLLFIF